MNAISKLVLLVAALLSGASGPDQTNPTSASSSGAKTALAQAGQPAGNVKAAEPTKGTTDQRDVQPGSAAIIESATENGVLVVRHSLSESVEIRKADDQAAKDRAVLAMLRAAAATERLQQPLIRFQTVRVDQLKYTPRREPSQAELASLWQYKPETNWKYRPVPERSQAEVERLTRYRPMIP